MKENFKKFVLSLYKPVKSLTFIMIGCMIISQILDLVKQYIIKGIINLPSMENFQTTDLYKTVIILLCVIVLELIFYYTSNITRTIHMVKKQTPYISEKLFNILDKKTYSLDNIQDSNEKYIQIDTGKIEFRDMSFKYNKNYIFKDFNLEIKDKQKVGIIGGSGSGKTTLVNLIFKFYTPQHGSIYIDNKDISNYNTNSLYGNLTYVPQETILLHSTIYNNIKIAKPDATDEEIYNAAKKAELHNFIESLEYKYDTIVPMT